VVELSGCDQDQAIGHIMPVPPLVKMLNGDRFDGRLIAEHRTAHRLAGKSRLLEVIEDDVGRGVARLGEFLQDDLSLELEMTGFEMRPAHQVGEERDSKRQIGGQQADVESGQLAVGRSVDVTADIFDRLAQLARAASAGALEHHMLEQMGEAVNVGGFEA